MWPGSLRTKEPQVVLERILEPQRYATWLATVVGLQLLSS